jgi:TolA-binding protein
MTKTLRSTCLLLLALLGVAAPGAASAARKFYQAEYKFPPDLGEFDDDVERGFVQTIRLHHQKVALAREGGRMDEARAEWQLEAKALADFADKFRTSEYRISFRFNAAKLYTYSQQPDDAALQAEQVYRDDQANGASRALGAHLAAQAWLQAASAKQKAGSLPGISLPRAEQRQGRPLQPSVPAGEWKRFIDAADAYLANLADDPELKRPQNERVVSVPAGDVALRAAMIEYGFDNMEDAQKRLATVLARFGDDAEVMDQAAELYLQTFAVLKDDAGGKAALAQLKVQVAGAQAKATEPKAKELLAKLAERLAGAESGGDFLAATRLLEEGKPAESAAAYEAFLVRYPQDRQTVRALNNGAIAYEQAAQGAKEPEKAALMAKATVLREQILAKFPDSELAASAMLRVAEARDRAGKLDEAGTLFADYLAKYPTGPARCGALQNTGVILEKQKRPLDAAARYLEFAAEPRCKSEDLNGTGRLLFHAAELYDKAKKPKEAKAAYGALIALEGSVTDVVVKSYVREAKKRIKGL